MLPLLLAAAAVHDGRDGEVGHLEALLGVDTGMVSAAAASVTSGRDSARVVDEDRVGRRRGRGHGWNQAAVKSKSGVDSVSLSLYCSSNSI